MGLCRLSIRLLELFMITQTTWRPDTCECELSYKADTEHPELECFDPVFLNKCQYHSDLKNEEAYAQIKKENQSKNLVTADIKETQGIDVDWSFDENRNLVITADTPVEINPEKTQIDVLNDSLDVSEVISPVLNEK